MNKRILICGGFCLSLLSEKVLAIPIAVDDVRTIPANTSITIDVLNNDSDTNGLTPELDPASVTQPASGTVTVNADGSITYVPNQGFSGDDSFEYTISTTNNGVTDTATASVLLTVNPSLATEAGLGFNMRSVAVAIDQVCAQLAGFDDSELSQGALALRDRCAEYLALVAADSDAARSALRAISPEETLAIARLGANALEFQADVVGARLSQLGRSLEQAGGAGIVWSSSPSGAAAGDESILARLGFFASIQMEDADKDETLLESGFDYQAASVAFGLDWAASSSWVLGASLGFTANQLDFKDRGGEVSADIVSGIMFASYLYHGLSVDIQTGISQSSVDLSRDIRYAVVSGDEFETTTDGNTTGVQWFVSTQLQYGFSFGAWSLYPSLKYQYRDSSIDRFADVNAGGWDVVLGKQESDQSKLEAAFQVTYAHNTNWGVLVPNVELRAIDDLDYDQIPVTGYFAYAPGDRVEFNLYSEEPDSLYYHATLGCSAVFPRGISAFAGYSQTFGYEDFEARQLQLGVRLEF